MTKDDLYRFRERNQITQVELARELGVHMQTVSRWETGEVEIPKAIEFALKYIEARNK